MEHQLAGQMSANMVFTLWPSAHLRPLATLAGLGTISRNSDIVRFVRHCPISVLLPTGGLDRAN